MCAKMPADGRIHQQASSRKDENDFTHQSITHLNEKGHEKMKKEQNVEVVNIVKFDIRTAQITLVGDTPLISHAWSEKAKRMMLEKQMKKASSGKEAKDPWLDFCNSLYWLTDKPEYPTEEDIANATFGFPVVAFKAAAIDAAYQQGMIAKKTTARGAFHIDGEYAVIESVPVIREDMVKIGMGTADIRYRGEFKNWRTTLTVRYNATAISLDQIVNYLNMAGFAVGVGEWRPGRDGSYGTFHVLTAND